MSFFNFASFVAILVVLVHSSMGRPQSKFEEEHQPNHRVKRSNETLPDPHIIILGLSGVGKSSLASVLISMDPSCKNCTFKICAGANSCTKDTSYAVGSFPGGRPLFTVVDTPGLADSDNEDNRLIEEMVCALKDTVKTANALLLVLNGNNRFDGSVQQMVRKMQSVFGKENFWSHAILDVSHWSFSLAEQSKRNFTGETEEWWSADVNKALREKFHTESDIPVVFIDSFAKMPFNLQDANQQEAFDRETAKLWNLAHNMEAFEFKTIEGFCAS